MSKKINKKEIERIMKVNSKDYNTGILIGAFFKKLYGVYPKIRLSGLQILFVDELVEKLPDKLEEEL